MDILGARMRILRILARKTSVFEAENEKNARRTEDAVTVDVFAFAPEEQGLFLGCLVACLADGVQKHVK